MRIGDIPGHQTSLGKANPNMKIIRCADFSAKMTLGHLGMVENPPRGQFEPQAHDQEQIGP